MAGVVGAGLDGLTGESSAASAAILVYHRTAPACDRRIPQPSMNVRPEPFRRQLRGLLGRGFRFDSLSTLIDHWEARRSLPAKTLAVTFDDGFQSVARWAVPILRDLQIPATVFLSTAFLDSTAPFPFDRWGQTVAGRVAADAYRPLTWATCRELSADGLITFGSHTHTHADFRGRLAAFESDVDESIRAIQARLDSGPISFAFPFGRRALGQVNDEMISTVRRLGARAALTTDCAPIGRQAGPFHWGRINVYDWDSAATVAAKIAGWYGWTTRVQEWCWERGLLVRPAAVAAPPKVSGRRGENRSETVIAGAPVEGGSA